MLVCPFPTDPKFWKHRLLFAFFFFFLILNFAFLNIIVKIFFSKYIVTVPKTYSAQKVILALTEPSSTHVLNPWVGDEASLLHNSASPLRDSWYCLWDFTVWGNWVSSTLLLSSSSWLLLSVGFRCPRKLGKFYFNTDTGLGYNFDIFD